jgi:predicted TIM-barrel fold metal-dependent hydrolase
VCGVWSVVGSGTATILQTSLAITTLCFFLSTMLSGGASFSADPTTSAPAWRADHHMHLASPELCHLVGDCLKTNHPSAVYAADAVRVLDEAHVAEGVILSCAYMYGMPSLHLTSDEVTRRTRMENEFTAAEVAKFPGRLVGFLSVDPLQDSAIKEIRHWRGSHQLIGLKLHFFASKVNLRNPDERRRVANVIAAAAEEHLPMVIHVGGGKFDAADAELFIRDVLPRAGSSWAQIAHAGGGIPSIKDNNLAVLRAFGDHMVRNDPVTRNVLFDLSFVPLPDATPQSAAAITPQMRRIGMNRFFFGSDFNETTPQQTVKNLARLHLTVAEGKALQGNCAPWAC